MSARVCTGSVVPSMDIVVNDLIEYTTNALALESDEPWKISSREASRLREAIGYTPPGGWNGLVGLAAGAGILEAQSGCFVPAMDAFEGDESDAHQLLLDAFRHRLCPPAAAAALFVALGVHPMYGLTAALSRQADPRGKRLRSSLPNEAVVAVETVVFGTIAYIFEGLSGHATKAFDLDDLAGLVCGAKSTMVPEPFPSNEGLPPFVTLEVTASVARMCACDLLDFVLVPAGFARRFDDETFIVLRPLV